MDIGYLIFELGYYISILFSFVRSACPEVGKVERTNVVVVRVVPRSIFHRLGRVKMQRKLFFLLFVLAAIVLAACTPDQPQVMFTVNGGTPVSGVAVDFQTTPAAPAAAPAATVVAASAAPVGGFRLLAEGECAPSGSHVVMKDYVRSDATAKVYAFTTDSTSVDVCRQVTSWGWRVVWVFDTHDNAVAYGAGEYSRVLAATDADPSAPGSNQATVIEFWIDGAKQ